METSWLLDPSIPLNDVFRGYAGFLASQLAPSPLWGTRPGAMAAADLAAEPTADTEVFRRGEFIRPRHVPATLQNA
jgi:hypothetical protein